jgi:hypothetical protein
LRVDLQSFHSLCVWRLFEHPRQCMSLRWCKISLCAGCPCVVTLIITGRRRRCSAYLTLVAAFKIALMDSFGGSAKIS